MFRRCTLSRKPAGPPVLVIHIDHETDGSVPAARRLFTHALIVQVSEQILLLTGLVTHTCPRHFFTASTLDATTHLLLNLLTKFTKIHVTYRPSLGAM